MPQVLLVASVSGKLVELAACEVAVLATSQEALRIMVGACATGVSGNGRAWSTQ
jgi:hypothetical protein